MKSVNFIIDDDVVLNDNVSIGNFCHLNSGVTIGRNTVLMNYVEFRSGAYIGDDCFADYVSLRVMANNLHIKKKQVGGAKIEKACFVGTNAVLQHGIILGDNRIVGSMSIGIKNLILLSR